MSSTATSPDGSERASPILSSPSTSISSNGKSNTTPPWIIHHLLIAPIRWEMPLRIMFLFNRGRDLPKLETCHRWWYYEPQGQYLNRFFSNLKQIQGAAGSQASEVRTDKHPDDRYMDLGNDVLFDEVVKEYNAAANPKKGDEDQRTPGITLTLVQDVCLKMAFRSKYEEANFYHALKAIDYLRDLEYTRRSKLRQAAMNLKITESDWMEVLSDDPDALKWIEETEKAELEIELLYASLYVDLRIWTMISMLKRPTDKKNVLALINTLFPPGEQDLPNDRIIPKVLNQYRATFFQYITALEKTGNNRVVDEFEKKMLMRDNRHNYSAVRWRLEEYLSLAERMITKSELVYGIEFFRSKNTETSSDRQAVSTTSPKNIDDSDSKLRALTSSTKKSPTPTLKSVVSIVSIRSRFHSFSPHRKHKITADSASVSNDSGAEHDTGASVSYPPPPPSEPEELRVVAERIRSFSRPTEFVYPNSEAAKHAEFTKLRETSSLPPPDIPIPSPSTAMFVPPPLRIQKTNKLETDNSLGKLVNSEEIGVSDASVVKPKLTKAATFGSVEEFTPESKKSEPDLTKKPSMSSLKRTKRAKSSTTSGNISDTNQASPATPALPTSNNIYDASPVRNESSQILKIDGESEPVTRSGESTGDQNNTATNEKPSNPKPAVPVLTLQTQNLGKIPINSSKASSPNRTQIKDSTDSGDKFDASIIAYPFTNDIIDGAAPLPPRQTAEGEILQANKEFDSTISEKQSSQELNNAAQPTTAVGDSSSSDIATPEMDPSKAPKRKFASLRRQRTTPTSSPKKSMDEITRPSTSDSSRKNFFSSHLHRRKASFGSPSKAWPSVDDPRPSTSGSQSRKRPPPISTAQPAKPILKNRPNETTGFGGYLRNLGRNWAGNGVVQPTNVNSPPPLLTPNPLLPNDGGKFLENEWRPTEFAVEGIEKEGGKVRKAPGLASFRGAIKKAKSMTDIVHHTTPDSLSTGNSSKNAANSDIIEKKSGISPQTAVGAFAPSTPEMKPKKLQKKASNASLKSKSSTKFKISDPTPIGDIELSLGTESNLIDIKALNKSGKSTSNNIKASNNETKTPKNLEEFPILPSRPQTAPELTEKNSDFDKWPSVIDEARLQNVPWKYRHNYAERDIHRQRMKWDAWLRKERNPPSMARSLEGKLKGIIGRPKLFKDWANEEDTREAKPLPPYVSRNSDNPVPRLATYEVREGDEEKWKDWEVVGGKFGEKISPWIQKVDKVHRSQRERDSGVIVYLPYTTEQEDINLEDATPEQWDEILANRRARIAKWKDNKDNRVVRLVQPDYSIYNPKDDEIIAAAERERQVEVTTTTEEVRQIGDAPVLNATVDLPLQFRFPARTKSKKKIPPKIEKGQVKRLADVFPLSQSEAEEFRAVNENDSVEVKIPFNLTVNNNYERVIIPIDDWEDVEKEQKRKKKDGLRKVKSFTDLTSKSFSGKSSMVSLGSAATQTPAIQTPYQNDGNNALGLNFAADSSVAVFQTANVFASTSNLRSARNPSISTFQTPATPLNPSFTSSYNTPPQTSSGSFNTTTSNSGIKSSPSLAALFKTRSRKPSAVSFADSLKSRNTSLGSNTYSKYTPTLNKQRSTFNLGTFGLKKRDVRRSSVVIQKRLSDRAVFRNAVSQRPRKKRRGVSFSRRESLIQEEIYLSTALTHRMRQKVLAEKESKIMWKLKEKSRRLALNKAGRTTKRWDESSDSSDDEEKTWG